jgi:hypothetical protein
MINCHWRSEDDVDKKNERHTMMHCEMHCQYSLLLQQDALPVFFATTVKVEELIPRSAQVLILSSNTAEVRRLWSNAAEVWRKRRVIVIEDSGRFDRDIEDSGRVSTVCDCKQWECSTENHLICIWELLCWTEANCEWLILCVVIFLFCAA